MGCEGDFAPHARGIPVAYALRDFGLYCQARAPRSRTDMRLTESILALALVLPMANAAENPHPVNITPNLPYLAVSHQVKSLRVERA